MRLAVGQIMYEVDIFSPVRTTIESCRQAHLVFDHDVLRFHRDKQTELAGVIGTAGREGVQLVPTLSTLPIPSGPFTNETYAILKGALLDRLAEAGDLDGVILVLHGAAATEDLDDAEGDLLSAVRTQLGEEVPLVVTLDFHACLSSRMVENVDAIIGYRTCPHVDQIETGERAVKMMLDMLRRGIKPVMALEKIPMLIPYGGTLREPMKTLMQRARDIEQEEGVLAVSLFDSQAETGMKELGRSVVVVAESESALAQSKATELRNLWWEARKQFESPRISTEECLALIRGPHREPLILNARGDDPFSGAPGDGNYLLRMIIGNRIENALVAAIPDPESVQQAIAAGIGARIALKIGGKMDHLHHRPYALTGTVTHITSGRYRLEGTHVAELDMGRAAAWRVGDTDIILTENRMPAWDPDFVRLFRIEPEDKSVLVLRSPGARWHEISPRLIQVDTPGCFNSRLILDWIREQHIKLDYNYLEP